MYLNPEKCHALHVFGNLHPGQGKQRGREVDETDQPIVDRARRPRRQMTPLGREADDQRHVQPAVVEPALASRHAPAVVAVEKHDGIVRQAVFFELAQNLAYLAVHCTDAVVVSGHIAADHRRVGIERRQLDPGRIMACFPRQRSQQVSRLVAHVDLPKLPLMGGHDVEHRHERLAWFTPPPMAPRRVVVPDARRLGEVVILFAGVHTVVAHLAQIHGIGLDEIGDLHRAVAQVRSAHATRPHAGDQARSGGRARRSRGKRPGVAYASGGQGVEIGRDRLEIAEAAQVGVHIFAGDPEDVRP